MASARDAGQDGRLVVPLLLLLRLPPPPGVAA